MLFRSLAMCSHLMEAGYSLTVFNRTAAKLRPEYIEKGLGVPVKLIGVGQERSQTIDRGL